MVDIPPGIVYIVSRAPKLAAPLATAFLLTTFARSRGIDVPGWLLALFILASYPIALALHVQWRLFMNRRAAARLGAVLAPTIPDTIPGGLRLMMGGRKAAGWYPAARLDDLFNGFGNTLNTRIFFQNRIITTEPEYIKAVLASQFDDFEKGAETTRTFYPLLGTGVFAADGDMWKFHRAMTRPYFTKDRIGHFDVFDRHAADAVAQMRNRFNQGIAVDFQDIVARFTLDSATEFLLGHDVRSLSEELPYPFNVAPPGGDRERSRTTSSGVIRSFKASQDILLKRIRFGDHWPLSSFFKDDIKEHTKVLHGFVDPIVASAIQKKKAGAQKEDDTLLQNLVNSTEDPIILRDEVMNLLVAGRDTTACLLTFTIYMLSEHPAVFSRLREEVMSQVGPSGRPTIEDFREMKYLRAVLNETLRLYPPVPFNVRRSKAETVLPPLVPGDKPLYIAADTRISYSVITMHRRTDLWGPDALEFDPDRFLDNRLQKYLIPSPFIFLPFNAGPRICLGQQFAYHEASFFLVRLLQAFSSISLAPEAQPPESRPPLEWASSPDIRIRREKVKPKTHLTLYVQGGLWVRMGGDSNSE